MSLIGIFDEGFEDTAGFVAERTATPILIRSLNKWNRSYTYRMKFVWLNVASAGRGGRSNEGFVPPGGPGRSTESARPQIDGHCHPDVPQRERGV